MILSYIFKLLTLGFVCIAQRPDCHRWDEALITLVSNLVYDAGWLETTWDFFTIKNWSIVFAASCGLPPVSDRRSPAVRNDDVIESGNAFAIKSRLYGWKSVAHNQPYDVCNSSSKFPQASYGNYGAAHSHHGISLTSSAKRAMKKRKQNSLEN